MVPVCRVKWCSYAHFPEQRVIKWDACRERGRDTWPGGRHAYLRVPTHNKHFLGARALWRCSGVLPFGSGVGGKGGSGVGVLRWRLPAGTLS